jgi:hypothetical protein
MTTGELENWRKELSDKISSLTGAARTRIQDQLYQVLDEQDERAAIAARAYVHEEG